ncbi:LysM peptidoglycan-binding domain-containing protein [Sphingomonas sp. CGMCC 1.13654]|uniref:LysM peptidoglycan-binding domain-containing protein n=1 Tax=Sphingomonas chungangi TaxID=2683589 RepID=A0A838L475_9SPHN|nr:phage tail tip lysozyme [Sphingomonas chungangi]MBA2934181.1 LysM peptidoglycan-binding domain-containing protein [Sphingomonas chungangi]MVW57222.1 LysM peptidoglycan-binding domain-containing protein [Sphingomonas chungangi]
MSVSSVQGSVAVNSSGSDTSSYTVRSGDCLWNIARAHGVSLSALEQANPQIANPDLIHPGQRITIPGGSGSTGSVGGTPGAGDGSVADIARSYLGQNASSLKTNGNDNLPMDPNCPSTECCANFVSAVLVQSGELPSNLHTDSVEQLKETLQSRGWTAVPASEAKAGDVVIMQGGGISHTEIVAGPGQMIGSNNINADGTQKVSTNSLSYAQSHGGLILRAPASAAPKPAGGTAAPSGDGSESQRIDQAMQYFEGQGWSKAQAAGIVANLDAESGLRSIPQNGGGPGYGIAQWEGPRQAEFQRWSGHDIHGSSFAEQLRFVQHELTTTEAGAGNALKQTNDAREAGQIVTRLYERPADTAGQSVARGNRAADIYANH